MSEIDPNRRFFAAGAWNVHIFEMRGDGAYREMPLSILTKKDRKRCGEIIGLLTAGRNSCALKSANYPTDQSAMDQAEEFVLAIERRHADQTWWEWNLSKCSAK